MSLWDFFVVGCGADFEDLYGGLVGGLAEGGELVGGRRVVVSYGRRFFGGWGYAIIW